MKNKIDYIVIFGISFILPVLVCIAMGVFLNYNSYDVSSFEGIEVSKTLLGTWATLLGFIVTAESILIYQIRYNYDLLFYKQR